MASSGKDEILAKQVITKLLDFQNSGLPESVSLQLLHPTLKKPASNSDASAITEGQDVQQQAERKRKAGTLSKKAVKKRANCIVLIIIAWILLLLNVLAVLIGSGYGQQGGLKSSGADGLIGWWSQVVLLVFGLIVLIWATRLYLKRYSGETIALPALIIVALGMMLVSSMKKSNGGVLDIEGFGRSVLSSVSSGTTPIHRLWADIFHSKSKPSSGPGGTIVHEGDFICGIKVVKIYKDRVEFEKDGERWTQPVETRPAPYY